MSTCFGSFNKFNVVNSIFNDLVNTFEKAKVQKFLIYLESNKFNALVQLKLATGTRSPEGDYSDSEENIKHRHKVVVCCIDIYLIWQASLNKKNVSFKQ